MNILFCSVGRRCELLKDFRKTFELVCQSMTFAKLDYFKKVMDLSIKECMKKEETKRDFRN